MDPFDKISDSNRLTRARLAQGCGTIGHIGHVALVDRAAHWQRLLRQHASAVDNETAPVAAVGSSDRRSRDRLRLRLRGGHTP